MTITLDRAENGVITIDDGDVSVDYPKPDLRLHFSEKNQNCRILYGVTEAHRFKLTDIIIINGVTFSGTIVQLQQTLRTEIFFLADDGGGGGGSLTPGQIVTKLQSLEDDARLDASAIKNLPSGGGINVQTAATNSAIGASTEPRMIIVTADETEAGQKTIYIHNGTALTKIAIAIS